MLVRTEPGGEISSLEAEWDRIALDSGAPPFMRPGWISAWWEAFGNGELEFVTARREGRLVGLLPLVSRRRAIFAPANWHTPGYGAVAVDDAVRLALYEGALGSRPRRLDLSFLAAGPAGGELLGRAASGYRLATRVMMRSPYVPVDGDWDSYWSSLSKNLKGTVRRCRNRLADRGEVTVEVAEGRTDLDALLADGFRLEASGWKGEEGTAIVSRPETRRFYEAVSRWAADAGILRLAFLRIDGEAVAFNLSFEAADRHYLLKPGHDAALDSLGPGTVLTAEMVQRSFTLGFKAYEFLGKDDRYKLRWTDSCHELLRVQAFAATPSGGIDRLLQTRGRDAAKKLLRRGG
jgi:CelD/BcsL family acetyltransferase involved in cellulose biosynthesis